MQRRGCSLRMRTRRRIEPTESVANISWALTNAVFSSTLILLKLDLRLTKGSRPQAVGCGNSTISELPDPACETSRLRLVSTRYSVPGTLSRTLGSVMMERKRELKDDHDGSQVADLAGSRTEPSTFVFDALRCSSTIRTYHQM